MMLDEESQEKQSLDEFSARYLGCDPGDVNKLEREVMAFWEASMRLAIDTCMKNTWNVIRIFGFKQFTEEISYPVFRKIEVAPDTFQKVLYNGGLCLQTRDGEKIVLTFYTDQLGNYTRISVLHPPGADEAAENLLDEVIKKMHELSMLRGSKIGRTGRFLNLKKATWDDISIPRDVVEEIEDNVLTVVNNLDRFKALGLQTSRGVLISGPPGVGKTLLGTILANQAPCTFIMVSPKDIQMAEDVAELFENARTLAPTIVYFEDIDHLVPSRDMGWAPEILFEFLNQIEGLELNRGVFTIATTNHPEKLEKAMSDRPGRIDRRLRIDPPGITDRRRILEILLGQRLVLDEDVSVDMIMRRTEGFTGAHLRDLVHTSVVELMKEKEDVGVVPDAPVVISSRHVTAALDRIGKEHEKFRQMYA